MAELLSEEKDFLKAALQEVVQEVLEVEMEPLADPSFKVEIEATAVLP